MSKYIPLNIFLCSQSDDSNRATITFEKISDELGIDLPQSALTSMTFWRNDKSYSKMQAIAWISAGWEVESVDLEEGNVTFVRTENSM